ncbi:MAG: hypothetical protein E7H57_13830 [Pantoea sp.]|nr:hypothetical protein [Pantoea sp.]
MSYSLSLPEQRDCLLYKQSAQNIGFLFLPACTQAINAVIAFMTRFYPLTLSDNNKIVEVWFNKGLKQKWPLFPEAINIHQGNLLCVRLFSKTEKRDTR